MDRLIPMLFDPDTKMGGSRDHYPSTQGSLLAAASSGPSTLRREALSSVLQAYWKPVYKYLRLHWHKSNEDAKDLTQGFFASLLERDLIGRYDPAQAAFRTYLRICVDGFVSHQAESESRLKRGGDIQFVPLDFDLAEHELSQGGNGPWLSREEFFHREWQRELFSLAVEDLRRHCQDAGKQVQFALFEEYDLSEAPRGERPTYDQLALEHGLAATTVTNHLAWARRELRRLLLERVAAITSGDREFTREARELLR